MKPQVSVTEIPHNMTQSPLIWYPQRGQNDSHRGTLREIRKFCHKNIGQVMIRFDDQDMAAMRNLSSESRNV